MLWSFGEVLDVMHAGSGLPRDQLSIAICLLLSFPLALTAHWYLVHVRGPKSRFIKFLMSLGPTEFFLYLCYYLGRDGHESMRLKGFLVDWLSVHLPIIAVWLGCRYSRFIRNHPVLILIGLLTQLAYTHLRRQIYFYNQYVSDVTGPLMLLTIKLSSFAFDLSDAREGKESSEEERAVLKADFIDYLGWSLFFAGFLTGPTLAFSDYCRFFGDARKYLELSEDVESEDGRNKEKEDRKKEAGEEERSLKGRKRRVLHLILSSSLLLILGIVLKARFPIEALTDPSKVKGWTGIPGGPFLYPLAYLHFSQFHRRSHYYIAWQLSEASIVLLGLGYHSGHKWTRYENVNPIVIESAWELRTVVAEWNICTNRWLNRYVYQRFAKFYSGSSSSNGNGKPGFLANLMTYWVSAVWHGFYPGYYILFVSGALLTHLNKLIYRNVTWPFAPRLKRYILYIPTWLLLDYLATCFVLQTWRDNLRFLKYFWFWGHFVIGGGLTLMTVMTRSSHKRHNRRNSKKD